MNIPWTRDTFPNGVILYFRQKGSDEVSTPDGILNKGIRIGVRIINWSDLFYHYECSQGHHPTKAHWSACGVHNDE